MSHSSSDVVPSKHEHHCQGMQVSCPQKTPDINSKEYQNISQLIVLLFSSTLI